MQYKKGSGIQFVLAKLVVFLKLGAEKEKAYRSNWNIILVVSVLVEPIDSATLLFHMGVLPRNATRCNNMQYYEPRHAPMMASFPQNISGVGLSFEIAHAPWNIRMYIPLGQQQQIATISWFGRFSRKFNTIWYIPHWKCELPTSSTAFCSSVACLQRDCIDLPRVAGDALRKSEKQKLSMTFSNFNGKEKMSIWHYHFIIF